MPNPQHILPKGVEHFDVYEAANENGEFPTGRILPRDFGMQYDLKLPRSRHSAKIPPRYRVFNSPLRSARGLLVVQEPEQIKRRFAAFAEETGLPVDETINEFFHALAAADSPLAGKTAYERTGDSGIPWIVAVSGRDAIKNVKPTARGWRAEIARSHEDEHRSVEIARADTPQGAVGIIPLQSMSEDWKYNTMNGVQGFDMRTAALEWAFFLDQNSRLSAEKNLTGLTPSHRPKQFTPLFNLYENGIDGAADLSATRLLFTYHVEGKDMFETDLPALYTLDCLTPAGLVLQRTGAKWRPLRQAEAWQSDDGLSKREQRIVENQRGLYQRMRFALEHPERWSDRTEDAYKPIGYTVAFVGTPWEEIGRVFRSEEPSSRGNEVHFTLVTGKDYSPVLVRRELLGRAMPSDSIADPHPDLHPHDRRRQYTDVDPMTRHWSMTRVITPPRDTKDMYVGADLVKHNRLAAEERAKLEFF